MKTGKCYTTEEIEFPNQENIWTQGETYRYLEILEANIIKQWRWEKKF